MFGPRSVNPFIEKNAKKRHDAIRTFPLNSVSRDRHVRVIINFHFVLIKKLQNVIMRDALLFDIDGTLLYARGVGRAAFGAAFLAAYGRPYPDVGNLCFVGATDSNVVRMMAASCGIISTPAKEEHFPAARPRHRRRSGPKRATCLSRRPRADLAPERTRSRARHHHRKRTRHRLEQITSCGP